MAKRVGADPRIRVGISNCLLGLKVRYDGGHKLDTLITETLGRYFEWVPVCPEMETGLGVPRETLHLAERARGTRLVGTQSGVDHTAAMTKWAAMRLGQLENLDLAGYILKKDSPSCGMERVRMVDSRGKLRRDGTGVFAALLLDRFGLLPVAEEGRLHNPGTRNVLNKLNAKFAADCRGCLPKSAQCHRVIVGIQQAV